MQEPLLRLMCGAVVFVALGLPRCALAETPVAPAVAPALKLLDAAAKDQDDMCVWVHPTDRSKSTVITSDKTAHKIFVYDLNGKTLQSVSVPTTGNIDVRYGFPLGAKRVDIVACNQREDGFKILVFSVNPITRQLTRIDDGRITTGESYGGTLYRSRKSARFFFITTSKNAGSEEFELVDDGQGRVRGKKVRSLKIGFSEGAVADDDLARLYIAEEQKGIWEVGAEPDDTAPPRLAIKIGEHGLVGDIEGLTIYDRAGGKGYLIASMQGSSRFNVYRREAGHAYVGTFSIRGARETDGIAVAATALGSKFPHGLFACHSDPVPCAVLVSPWHTIAGSLGLEVDADSTRDPRAGIP